MYGEHVLADWIFHHVSTFAGAGSWAASHTLATILSVAFLTYLHIVLGEMIPKSLALQSAERIGAVDHAADADGHPGASIRWWSR